jgi:catechol 2,3-dioxygenase-like lactoylglutathione lyase family enzyme
MQTSPFSVLYVSDLAASVAFYTAFLGRPPVDASQAFAMFVFDNKGMLGLWQAQNVIPPDPAGIGGSEVTFLVADQDAVDRAHAGWIDRGFAVGLKPTDREFGYSAVVLDPDGHRIRAMKPNG